MRLSVSERLGLSVLPVVIFSYAITLSLHQQRCFENYHYKHFGSSATTNVRLTARPIAFTHPRGSL